MAQTTPQELSQFFDYVVTVLERLNIPYMVAGGFAAIVHGEPRLTIDVDIVADIKSHHIKALIQAFPSPDYYVSEEAMIDSLRRRFPFNIIQTTTGAKADIVPLPDELFSRIALSRRQKMVYSSDGKEAYFISAEDIVAAKLFAYQQTGSDKHLRDARGVLVTQWNQLNLELIRRMVDHRGLLAEFEKIYEAARQEVDPTASGG
ncbi:MAG: hypothetical protein KDI02_16705 [Anaerolineae bacterium]|nr:hypothetical protein [Anaerolineae bacterium]MCB0181290.1 hypothetical protein [Anaerolineae bacterium]MCB0225331.1 hypothetical protein [Anaerolineae bacterium]